jgi:non-canonical purine NTP pyrophosphatase (RdgB/HAM1 family)
MFPIRYFATSNPNKLREVNEILGARLEHMALELDEPQTMDLTAIVTAKARQAYERAGEQPVLVEDTSLELLAWNGLPGPFIKWFLDRVGASGIAQMLGASPDRRAVARTAVAYHDGMQTYVYIGETTGTISDAPRGETGFGWDVIFIPASDTRTFAQMPHGEKHRLSMRARALAKLKDSFL